jgi:hypothetical protein
MTVLVENTESSNDSSVRELEKMLRSREEKVSKADGVRAALNTLERNGADVSKVLRLLVYSALKEDAFNDPVVKWQRKRLSSLSRHLQDVANELKAVFTNPDTFPAAFLARWSSNDLDASAMELTPSFEARIVLAEQAAKLMEQCAKKAEQDKLLFAAAVRALNKWSGTDAIMSALIEHVYATTGKFSDDLLADLLQAADDILRPESRRQFTEEGIRKFRQRHVGPSTGLLVKNPRSPKLNAKQS